MRAHMKLIGQYIRINLSSAMAYRGSFYLQAFGMMLSNLSFIFFWWVAFGRVDGLIGGYTFRDVMFIWSVASSAFGLSHIVFGNLSQITRLIVNGELDTFLLQPKNLLLNLLCARSEFGAWGDLLYGFGCMAFTQSADVRAWGFFLAAVFIGALLFTATSVLAHASTFFTGESSLLGRLVTEFMLNFCLYPFGIYPMVIRALMFTVMPAAYLVHMPLWLARGSSLWLFVLLLAFTGLYWALARFLFYKGLKRYASGNLIQTRM